MAPFACPTSVAVTLTWAQASDEPGSIFFALLLLILAVVVLFGVVMFLKKWMRKSAEAGDVGFTLSDLRELHRQGKMTTDEFERAKAQMVASAKAAIARKEVADKSKPAGAGGSHGNRPAQSS